MNTGFSSERAGSAMMSSAPVASRTGNGHQMNGKKRRAIAATDCSLPRMPSKRRSIIKAELTTAATARICTVCTAGTIHPTVCSTWLKGVAASQVQNESNDCSVMLRCPDVSGWDTNR